MGILTAQNDSVRSPGFEKHTIGVNLSALLTGDRLSIQYRRTQGKFHLRSNLNFINEINTARSPLPIGDTLWWCGTSPVQQNYTDTTSLWRFTEQSKNQFDLRIGAEKQISNWKKLNVFVGCDLRNR